MKCSIDKCLNEAKVKGVCCAHYLRLKRYGRTNSVKRKYGTGTFQKAGYHVIRVNGKATLSHRYIMEQHLGRKLNPNETVHHINGNPSDNRIENLVVLSYRDHLSLHRPFHKKRIYTDKDRKNLRQKALLREHKRNPKTGRFVPN